MYHVRPLSAQAIRTFTNGIIWWSQSKFQGDQFASDVIMICKHLRSTFRYLCLELLPLWVWGGKGEEPRPEPVPERDADWEAEVRCLWCPRWGLSRRRGWF